jgi:hypothetical protein
VARQDLFVAHVYTYFCQDAERHRVNPLGLGIG